MKPSDKFDGIEMTLLANNDLRSLYNIGEYIYIYIYIYMKSSDAKASKISIFIRLLCVGSVISH